MTRQSCWVLLALGLSACSPRVNRAQHTVDEYRADAALRNATLKTCENDPGTLARAPDCINVEAAFGPKGNRGGLRDLPPLNLDPAKNPLKGKAAPSDAEHSEPDPPRSP